MSDIGDVITEVRAIVAQHVRRDRDAAVVAAIRHGDAASVAPGLFSEDWPGMIGANRIDVMARHAAAALSALPTLSCRNATRASDAARQFDDTRTKIVNAYVDYSDLEGQMYSHGADQFYNYGLAVTSIEPDVVNHRPILIQEESTGFYPVWDRLGATVKMVRKFQRSAVELLAEYPDMRRQIMDVARLRPGEDRLIDLVKYESGKRIVLFLGDTGAPLLDSGNPMGRCTYVATRRPGLDRTIRGAFDDLVWVQLALHSYQMMNLSAVEQAVEAPLAVPNDVIDVATGPGAIIRSNTPQAIGRVQIEVPASSFAAVQVLENDLQYGAIVPQALSGELDAGTITGKGVQQLMAGYSQQMAMCQGALTGHFRRAGGMALEMDEKFWPDERKTITGKSGATPYRVSYTPSKDIAGAYDVDAQYGGVAGLDANRAAVFILQLRGAGLVSKDFARGNLPVNIDGAREESQIAVEATRESLLTAVQGMAASVPAMAASGGDPTVVVKGLRDTLKALQQGKSVEVAMDAMFPEPEPQPQQVAPDGGAAQMPPQMMAGAAGGGQPQGRPSLQMLFAGLTNSGNPNLQAGISRQLPAAS